MIKLWLLRQCKCIYFVENEVDNITCQDGNFGPKSKNEQIECFLALGLILTHAMATFSRWAKVTRF